MLNGERLWCIWDDDDQPGVFIIALFTPGCDELRYIISPPDGTLVNDKNARTDFTPRDLQHVGCIHNEPYKETSP